MAIMIPSTAREFDPHSLEGVMFDSLQSLDDEYYVIHSFKNVFVKDNILYESEADFVIFHPKYGIICIEAKAGRVRYEDGKWLYSSGIEMKHGGPYNQAAINKWNLLTKIQNSSLKDVQYKCKFLHAVWFPSVKKSELLSKGFPECFDRRLTLTMEALSNPQFFINEIFNINLENNITTDLSDNDVKRLLREIICPEFDIFPSASLGVDLKNITFNRLLSEQIGLLNYLVEQKCAVINGAAGTGKTMIAVEKARRHASEHEKVLFLCYNSFLRDYLSKKFVYSNVYYMTIDEFACSLCHTGKADYKMANEKIIELYVNDKFPYRHIIVDEGQDFGREDIEESEILQTMYDTLIECDKEGSFYVFYDKLQLVQSEHIPKFIMDADCKLTLYKNCRNTRNIAITSLKPITERKPVLHDVAIKGTIPKMYFCEKQEDIIQRIDDAIKSINDSNIEDVVILTCKTEESSMLAGRIKNGKYLGKRFTTCRKFKGLEADAIVLVDVSKEIFRNDNILNYYVGASRARIQLEIICDFKDNECVEILEQALHYTKKIKRPKRELASALNSIAII